MQIVNTADAPAAIGPYSQAVVAGDLCFCSGQIALDPASGQLVRGDIAAETRQVLTNLRAVLQAVGADLTHVVRTTVFLVDMNDFPLVNAAYAEVMGEARPARATVQVSRLPRDARVEIDAIASLPRA